MPPRFSLNTDLTLGVNTPLVATLSLKNVRFELRDPDLVLTWDI
jgi:hypothetical protein